ncbi:MAG: hypothetical protein V3V46_05315 [Anaerolineales bacterium]
MRTSAPLVIHTIEKRRPDQPTLDRAVKSDKKRAVWPMHHDLAGSELAVMYYLA